MGGTQTIHFQQPASFLAKWQKVLGDLARLFNLPGFQLTRVETVRLIPSTQHIACHKPECVEGMLVECSCSWSSLSSKDIGAWGNLKRPLTRESWLSEQRLRQNIRKKIRGEFRGVAEDIDKGENTWRESLRYWLCGGRKKTESKQENQTHNKYLSYLAVE